MSKYGVIPGPYFTVFELNTEIYFANLRIQSEYREIRTRNNSVFGHFSLFNSVFVDDKFVKPFKTYLGENAVYNFINNMIEESKYCSDVMKKYFNKKFVMTEEDKI